MSHTSQNVTDHIHYHHPNNVSLFTLPSDRYAGIIYGIVSPVVVLATLATNGVVCAVLLQKNMRTPVNTVLLAMAVADTLTGACPMPCFLNFFTLASRQPLAGLVPYNWCYLYLCLTDFLPTIFHTASLWLTVALAVQRFTTVCRGVDRRLPMTYSKRGVDGNATRQAVRVVLAIYAAAGLAQITRFFDSQYFPVVIEEGDEIRPFLSTPAMLSSNFIYRNSTPPISFFPQNDSSTPLSIFTIVTSTNVTSDVYCHIRRYEFFEQNAWLYFNVYFWFRVIFIHFVPCVVLLVMNGMLVCALRNASLRKRRLMQLNIRQPRHQQMQTTITTTDLPNKEVASLSTNEVQGNLTINAIKQDIKDEEVQYDPGMADEQQHQKIHLRRKSSLKIFRLQFRQKSPFKNVKIPDGKAKYKERKNSHQFKIHECSEMKNHAFEVIIKDRCKTTWKNNETVIMEGDGEHCEINVSQQACDQTSNMTSFPLENIITEELERSNLRETTLHRNSCHVERETAKTNYELSSTIIATPHYAMASKQILITHSSTNNHKSNLCNKTKSTRRNDNRHLTDIDNTTRMLIAVVGLVLLVELPQLCLIVIFVCMQNFHVVLIEDDLLGRLTVTSNLCIMLSYPLNFFIYCAMSRTFKTSIYQMLDCNKICVG